MIGKTIFLTMLPFKTLIKLDRTARCLLYLQIASTIIRQITAGVIPVGLKLPGGRKLAALLGVSRRTAMLAYEELEAQGWIEIKPNQGTFIHTNIPIAQKRSLPMGILDEAHQKKSFWVK